MNQLWCDLQSPTDKLSKLPPSLEGLRSADPQAQTGLTETVPAVVERVSAYVPVTLCPVV